MSVVTEEIIGDGDRDSADLEGARNDAAACGGWIMRRTAVALLDALGFKKIWSRHDPEKVLCKLQYLATEASEAVGLSLGALAKVFSVERRIQFFSDTLVLSCAAARNLDVEADGLREAEVDLADFGDYFAVWYVSQTAASFMSAAIGEGEIPLAYRGAIAFDLFESRDQFLIGPAIDEAAEAERLAEGALVWLCPSAVTIIDQARVRFCDGPLHEPFLGLSNGFALVYDYAVPIKNGTTRRAHVINPLCRVPLPLNDWVATLLETFGTDIGVQPKRRNTEAFLRSARVSAEANPGRQRLIHEARARGLDR